MPCPKELVPSSEGNQSESPGSFILPGPSLDDAPEPTTHILDFPLVQPCVSDHVLLSSRELADNMGKAGIPRSTDTAAHHIVAENERRAEEARRILNRFGVGINSADNGVYLPDKPESTAPGIYHRGLHTNTYYNEVNDRLRGAASRNEVLEALEDIRTELLNGTFPY